MCDIAHKYCHTSGQHESYNFLHKEHCNKEKASCIIARSSGTGQECNAQYDECKEKHGNLEGNCEEQRYHCPKTIRCQRERQMCHDYASRIPRYDNCESHLHDNILRDLKCEPHVYCEKNYATCMGVKNIGTLGSRDAYFTPRDFNQRR